MPAILPWSFTGLDDFLNCPRSFHEKRVLKSVQQVSTPEMTWGLRVHKAFEDRQAVGTALPIELQDHEDFMKRLEDRPGLVFFTEQKVALDLKLKPCHFLDTSVWWRGVIDYIKIDGNSALVVDYKTGKPHEKWRQLALFALHTFALHPNVDLVNAQFYWTKTGTLTRKVYSRAEIPAMWAQFIPDLRQYKEAFKADVWPPRQSGLCNGWCPVTKCEFWKPRRVR